MEAAIELNGVVKRYKGMCALDELTLSVPASKVYGLLGENGAGKTTALRTVTGLIRPDRGEARVMGERVGTSTPNAAKIMGAIIEAPGLYGNLTAEENVLIAAKLHKADTEQAKALLTAVGLSNTAKKAVKKFSTGMKQRLGIACALVHSPKILILDEPTIGLDPQGVIDLRKLIKKLAGEMDMTVVISSHILAEIEQVADMVGIIHKGRLIEQFNMADLAGADKAAAPVSLEQRFLTAVGGGAGERSEQ